MESSSEEGDPVQSSLTLDNDFRSEFDLESFLF